jgi:hypothetical protein
MRSDRDIVIDDIIRHLRKMRRTSERTLERIDPSKLTGYKLTDDVRQRLQDGTNRIRSVLMVITPEVLARRDFQELRRACALMDYILSDTPSADPSHLHVN